MVGDLEMAGSGGGDVAVGRTKCGVGIRRWCNWG